MSCYFTKIFVHLLVTAATCNSKVYKLIGRDLTDIYLFKVNSKNSKKRSEICPKLTINTVKRSPGVLIVNFEHYPHFLSVFLLLALNR